MAVLLRCGCVGVEGESMPDFRGTIDVAVVFEDYAVVLLIGTVLKSSFRQLVVIYQAILSQQKLIRFLSNYKDIIVKGFIRLRKS